MTQFSTPLNFIKGLHVSPSWTLAGAGIGGAFGAIRGYQEEQLGGYTLRGALSGALIGAALTYKSPKRPTVVKAIRDPFRAIRDPFRAVRPEVAKRYDRMFTRALGIRFS